MRELNTFELDMVNGGSDSQTGKDGAEGSNEQNYEQEGTCDSVQKQVGSTIVLFGS